MKENLLILSLKDFFSAKMLKYAILPFIGTLVLMYILFFVLAGTELDQLHGNVDVQTSQITIVNGVTHSKNFTAHLENSSIIQFLMKHPVTSWMASFLVYVVGGFFVLFISIFIAIIIVGFLTPFVLKELQGRYYQDVKIIGYSNAFEGIFLVLKWTFFMFLFFFLLIPFYFIPVVNIIAFNLPFYYFFHKILTYDISSNLTTREEDKQIRYFKKNSLRAKTLLLYLISLIPFAIFFGAVFYVIYLGHTYFVETRKIRL